MPKNNKLPKPMTPKQQQAMRKKEQQRKLEEIRTSAFEKGQRMAARYIARREGMAAGIKSLMSKNR